MSEDVSTMEEEELGCAVALSLALFWTGWCRGSRAASTAGLCLLLLSAGSNMKVVSSRARSIHGRFWLAQHLPAAQ